MCAPVAPIFGLIAVTGMRLSEAMGLERDDVDLDTGVLTPASSSLLGIPSAGGDEPDVPTPVHPRLYADLVVSQILAMRQINHRSWHSSLS